MLTFFRRIRKGLLGDGATSKYLLYALGEVLLVMVGILLALQVNNWNEDRKTKKQIELYLINLSESVSEDIKTHRRAASLNEFRFNSLQYILKFSGNEQVDWEPLPQDNYSTLPEHIGTYIPWAGSYPDTFNREFINRSFRHTVTFGNQVINTSVYDEMKSVGIFSKIASQKLKESIHNYYTFYDGYLDENRDWNHRMSTDWQSFVRDNFNMVLTGGQVIGDPLILLKDPRVIARIQELISPARYRAMNSYRAIESAENVIEEINEVLSNPQ